MSYFCLVNMPGVAVRDIVAIQAKDDGAAERELARVAGLWPGFETIALYQDERSVAVLSNPSLGFATEALDVGDLAA